MEWFGDQAVKVTFEDATGAARNRLVYRNEEPTLKIVEVGRPWSIDGDGAFLRLESEAFKHLGAAGFVNGKQDGGKSPAFPARTAIESPFH